MSGYGLPYRQPAGGWSNPRKAYFGGRYQHREPAINGLAKYVNNTNVQLQPGQVGRPQTRTVPDTIANNCKGLPGNGLPNKPWIGTGVDQFHIGNLPPNTFTPSGTNDLGLLCRLRGFKNVQAVRQWHGMFGFTAPESGAFDSSAYSDGAYTYWQSYSPTPTQKKYLTCATNFGYTNDLVFTTEEWDYLPGTMDTGGTAFFYSKTITTYAGGANISQSTSVNANTGERTLNSFSKSDTTTNEITNETIYNGVTTNTDSGATGPVYLAPISVCHPFTTAWGASGIWATFGQGTWNRVSYTGFNGGAAQIADQVAAWNATQTLLQASVSNFSITDSGFSATITVTPLPAVTTKAYAADGNKIHGIPNPGDNTPCDTKNTQGYTGSLSWTFTVTLSDPNYSNDTVVGSTHYAGVYSDVKFLLSKWALNDDGAYPWRTDGVWQIAPLVSRDEVPVNVSPLQSLSSGTVDDLRSPIADANGNAPFTHAWVATYSQTGWFDTHCWGWQFANGTNAAATSLVRFLGTGLILGLPLPGAFLDSYGYWFQALTGIPFGNYQNFFDFNANVWQACDWVQDGTSHFTQWYQVGWGEWLYDKIRTTGAQLPHNCTQWTNNYDAFYKQSYAYLTQADKGSYDLDGQAGPSTSQHAPRGDALWAQKCAEILEIWPSEDFFRPAGADRFAFDETKVYCVNNLTGSGAGSTWNLTNCDTTAHGPTVPASLTLSGVWGGASVGGFYTGCTYSFDPTVGYAGAGTLTLGTLVAPVPTGWTTPGGDTTTAFGFLPYFAKPGILGRAAIASTTDNGDGTTTLILSIAQPYLVTGDALDFFTSALVSGCETLTATVTNKTLTNVLVWQATTAYAVGELVIDSNGNVQQATSAGTTGSSAPTWLTTSAGGVTTNDGGVTWKFLVTGGAVDTTFKVAATKTDIGSATWVQTHGAPAWFWDDNGRKGDFQVYDWTADYRTGGEVARAASYPGTPTCATGSTLGAGQVFCNGFSAWNATQNPMDVWVKSTVYPKGKIISDGTNTQQATNTGTSGSTAPTFGTTLGATTTDGGVVWKLVKLGGSGVPFNPCLPAVVCISPNGEVFPNGVTVPFPTTFNFDDSYGASWQAEIEQAKASLFSQPVHTPCGDVVDPITDLEAGTKVAQMDDGNCNDSYQDGDVYHFIYQHFTFVESLGAPPSGAGCAGDQTAPTPAQPMAYVSPVNHSGGMQPPGMIGYDNTTGVPFGAWTFWGYRYTIESNCKVCRFNYAAAENFACVNFAAATMSDSAMDAPASLSGLGGIS